MSGRSWKFLQSAAACSVAFGAMTMSAQAQSAGSWVTKAPVPASLSEVGVAYAGGKVHVIGGSVLGFTGPYHVEYDPALDTWRVLAPMKAGRGSVAVVALDGKIHALGGRDPAGTTVTTHEVYDPATNSWKEMAPFPKARDHMAAGVIDGKIH